MPKDPKKAVYHGGGFSFGGSLQTNLMKGPHHGQCWTGDSVFANYMVGVDEDGNSLLTGEGAGMSDKKEFTIVDIEVFCFK